MDSSCGRRSSRGNQQLPSSGPCAWIWQLRFGAEIIKEYSLCVSLDLRSTTPPCSNFVTTILGAGKSTRIDRRGKLLGGEEALRLDCARLAIVAFRDIENDHVVCSYNARDVFHQPDGLYRAQTWRRQICPSSRAVVAANAGFPDVRGRWSRATRTLSRSLTDTLIAADEGR